MKNMEIKKLEIKDKDESVEMVFVPRIESDVKMAEIIFGHIIAEEFGFEIFDNNPYFSNEEIVKMLKSKETIFNFEYEETKFFSYTIVPKTSNNSR